MLIKILINYIIGYIRIGVEGYYIERFINLCRSNRIMMWNLKRVDETKIGINVGIKEFKKITKIAKKTMCKVEIIKKRGMPFFINKYKKRKIFLAVLLLIIISFFVSSKFLWNIEIEEREGQNIENLYENLQNAGLKVGILKSKINSKEIINKVRMERSDIAWLGIEIKGTNALIKVVKAVPKPEIIDDSDYCNIVSDKQGVITKISAQNGTIAVSEGDVVNIGDVLIKGLMEGKYTGVRYVHAKGSVEAKIWHTKNIKIMYENIERRETNNVENKYKIKLCDFEINFGKKLSKFEIYDTITTENKIKIFRDFYLPITILKQTNKEILEERKKYTLEEAKTYGIEELQNQFENEIENKEKIINRIINIHEEEDGIQIYMTYEVLENIGTNEKIVF